MRRSLKQLVDGARDMVVIDEAEDLAGALRSVQAERPSVLVVDLRLPDGSTIDRISQLREVSPQTGIVVVTMQKSRLIAAHVLDAGALGFVLKDSADTELVEAVRRAARREQFLSPRLGAVLENL